MRRGWAAIGLVIIGALCVGCSSDTSPGYGTIASATSSPSSAGSSPAGPAPIGNSSNSRPPASQAGSGSATPRATGVLGALERAQVAGWQAYRDTPTRIGFRLPTAPTRSTQSTGGLTERLYTSPIAGNGVAVSAAVLVAGSASGAQAVVSQYPELIRSEFQAAGAPADFAVSERRSITYQGRAGVDFRIGFTPTELPNETTVWLIRAVAAGPDVIVLQTIVGAAKTELAAYVSATRAVHAKLCAGLSLA